MREREIQRRVERGKKRARDMEVRETLKIREIEEIEMRAREKEEKRAEW